MSDALLTLDAAAAQLAISRRTLEREIAGGRIATVRVRGAVRVAQSDVDLYITNRAARPIEACTAAGVYLLLLASEVIYVGKSLNVLRRLGQHAAKRAIEFDAYHVIHCAPSDITDIERKLIARHQPKHNAHGRHARGQG